MRAYPLLLGLITLLHLTVATAQTPAGTIVRSQAVAIVNEETYFSNEVESLVRAVCGVSLTPTGTSTSPAHRLTALPASSTYLPYVITNTGNAHQTYSLALWQDAGNAWTASTHTYYLDANQNGRVDPNESPISSVRLEAGQRQHLILEIVTPAGAEGRALASPTTSCPGATTSPGNIASITIDEVASLLIEKYATPATVVPGGTLTFSLTVTNAGTAPIAGPVVITDMLNTPDLEGISFRTGTASSTTGTIEYFDGLTWSPARPTNVEGIRVTATGMAQDERVHITFDAAVDAHAAPGPRGNTVSATSAGVTSSTHYAFAVAPIQEHAFGPAGNSEALPGGEGSHDDEQTVGRLIENQPTCLTISMKNAGSGSDTYHLDVLHAPSEVQATFRTTAGTPLRLPLSLLAGEDTDFQLCLTGTAPKAEPFTITLRATSGRTGRDNETRVRVNRIESATAVTLHLTALPTKTLSPGQHVTYELRVTNTTTTPVTNARLTLPVPRFEGSDEARLAFGSATHDGSHDPNESTIHWSLASLGAGESFTRSATLRLPTDIPDGRIYTLSNAFTFRSDQILNPLTSNVVTHTFPGYELLATITATPEQVLLGGDVEFALTLTNPTDYPVDLGLHTVLPRGVTYVEGSGRVQVGAREASVTPAINGDDLAWDLGNEAVVLGPAGGPAAQLTLRYAGRTTPQTPATFSAEGWGTGTATVGRTTVDLASNHATMQAHVRADAFTTPEGLLTGRVYLDRDHDRGFEAGLDTPLKNARIVLSNGWQATTDEDGLYAFRSLEHGPWVVLLDPSSAPFPAPLGARQHIDVQGIHILDFPLQAPTGGASTRRSTTLRYGPVTVDKHLTTGDGRTLVTVTIETQSPLQDITVLDPQPDGSIRTWHLDTLDGKHEFTYHLPMSAPLLDPDVRWKDTRP